MCASSSRNPGLMKSQRRALIVDDEEPARKFLRKLLAAHPEISVVAEAGSVVEAVGLFYETRPDLVFLDVQMPKRNGFSLLPEMSPVPDIIFVTAHDYHAVKAFEVNAMDFLVKPIHPERLALSLLRLANPSKRRKALPFPKELPIFLYADREMRAVTPMEILFIEALHNHTKIHLSTHQPATMLRRISEWNRLLPAEIFHRLDRSTIINLLAIKDVVTLPNHHAQVRFQDSSEAVELGFSASRRLRKVMRESTRFSAFKPASR